MRPDLKAAQIGALDQGTIFTCGYAGRYPGCVVYGLAITARCDFAQGKYRILNYVPIVKLADWLLVDGLELIKERYKKELNGRLTGALKGAGLSAALLESIRLHDIARVHFSIDEEKPRKKREANQKFHNLVKEQMEYSQTLEEKNKQELYSFFVVDARMLF
ncbi:hypothetical protein [Hwanghaeella sp. LZ110]|uniref:hypothetical protein n=1 Tax=Hwanghaeella sp. LZ110 TaxID=3402810 RepID=UPI003B67487C